MLQTKEKLRRAFWQSALTGLMPLLLASPGLSQTVSSVAIASHGGTAFSTSEGFGNADVSSRAVARGGFAESHLQGVGAAGGRTTLFGDAVSHGGHVQVSGYGEAIGPAARSHTELAGSAYRGVATVRGHNVAGPYGISEVYGTALTEFGRAHAEVAGNARFGRAYTEGLSHSAGPLAYSRTMGIAHGVFGHPARSEAQGFALGTGPHAVQVETRSEAYGGGYSRAFGLGN